MKTVKESLQKLEESCVEKLKIHEGILKTNESLNQNKNCLESDIQKTSKNMATVQKDWEDRLEERKVKL